MTQEETLPLAFCAALLREAKDALEPFAQNTISGMGDGVSVNVVMQAGDLRRARAVCEKIREALK